MGLHCVTRLYLQTQFYYRSCRALSSPYYKKIDKKVAMVPQHSFCFSYNHIVLALWNDIRTVGACCAAARNRHRASL
jgi:hypothetical protein